MKRILYTLIGVMFSVGAWAQTLQEQINSAEAGTTITLTENITVSQTILIDKNITINGNGHTITSSVNNKLGAFYVNTGTCNFTIQNATIDGNSVGSMAVVAYRGKANAGLTTVDSGDRDNNNSGNVITLTGCTVKNFTGYPESYAGAVYAFGKSTVNLTNCTFSGNTTSLSADGASGADVWAGAAATVNISGGSYQEVFVNSNAGDNASITVSNGAKIEELAVCVTENGGSTNQPSITVNNATVANVTTETGNLIPQSAVTVENGGSITNLPTTYVAQIGDKKYGALAYAIAAAQAGETVTLVENIAVSAINYLNVTKAITLDLAGKKITSTVSEPIIVKETGDLTITGNGTIAGPEGEAGKALDGKAMITVEGALTYVNGTLTCGGAGSDGMYGVYVLDGGSAIFGDQDTKTGPTITSWFAAIGENNTTSPANITIYGGNYTSKASPSESDWWSYFCAPIYAAASGTINISGGEFNGYYGLSSRYGNVNQDLNISGGTFTGTKSALFIDNKSGVTSSETRDVAVSGGTFSSAVPEEYCANGYIPQDKGDGNYGVRVGTYVAQVGDKKFESLVEAIDIVSAGETVTLLADITVSTVDEISVTKKLTLDLAGKKITSTVSEPIIVKGTGDLTITGNGTIAGPEGEAGKALDGKAMITVEGALTYVNGTLTCGGAGSDGMYGVYVLDGGSATFGDQESKTGPTIASWFAAIGENNTTSPANITIYGGSYTSKASPSESDWWSYFCAPIYAAASGTINISGGEFNGYYGLSSRYGNVNQDLNISGGTFKGTKSALFIDNKSGVTSSDTRDVAVSGGTFSSAVPEEYCANGFIPEVNNDGTFGVKEGIYVAQIGENKYESIAEALNAITAKGQTITLIADVNETVTNTNANSFTIDLNGKTWSSDATSTFRNNGGTVTITDETGKGTIKNTANETDKGIAVWARTGSVVIENGNFINQSNYEATLYVGTTDANLDGKKPTITINGGSFKNEAEGKYAHNSALLPLTLNIINNIATADTYQAIVVNGGTFYGNDPSVGDDSQKDELSKNNNFIDPDFHAEMENGVFVIKTGGYVAKNGFAKYVTLDAALEAAKASETVTLLANAETTKETLPENVTINANGNELTMPTFIVYDGEAIAYPNVTNAETYKVRKATYIRTNISSTVWGTVCLPFSLTNENGADYYTYGSISGSTLTVDKTTTTVAPNTPVVFHKAAGDLNINEENATVSLNKTPTLTSGAGSLIGTYESKSIDADGSIYFINGNQFHKAQVAVTVPAYRAYISYNAPSGAAPRSLSIVVGGENNETGVETIAVDGADVNAVYDMAGRKMQAPRKGMSIVKLANGKTVKLFVK